MTNETMTDRQMARLAGLREAEDDFARLAANRADGLNLPEDGALRSAWLAAYAERFAELAEPYVIETQLIAAGREPRFHAGQRIEFATFEDFALKLDEWTAAVVTRYFEPEWQPLATVSRYLQLTVRVLGKRGLPIGKRIEVSERQVRLPQDAGVTS